LTGNFRDHGGGSLASGTFRRIAADLWRNHFRDFRFPFRAMPLLGTLSITFAIRVYAIIFGVLMLSLWLRPSSFEHTFGGNRRNAAAGVSCVYR
jgi:hypothetical protein